MKKFTWLFVLLFIVGITASCKPKDNGDKPDDSNDNKPAIDLNDDPNATHVRVYFECNNGDAPIMVEVEKGTRVDKIATPKKEGYLFTNWFADEALTARFNFYDKIYNSMVLYAGWIVDNTVDYSYVIENAVPSIVTGNLDLPKESEDGKASFTWSSSLPYTINGQGIVNKGREQIEVIMTMEAYDGMVTKEYTKPCVVEPIEFKNLKPGKMIFGYQSTWNFPGYFTEEQLMVDAINLSFAYVNSDATVDLSSCKGYFNDFLKVRNDGVRVILSIQGAGNETANFSNAASTPEKRTKFAKSVVDILETYHFDGVDIDWEYPGDDNAIDSEKVRYTLFMEELYKQVKAANKDYLVTGALPGGAYGWRRYDLKKLADSMDLIHLMTYDLQSSATVVHHTALYSNMPKGTATQASVNDTVELFTLAGFPLEKLTVGIAFYGRTTISSRSTDILGAPSKTQAYPTITYTKIKNDYLSQVGKEVEYHWDNICKAPYLFNKKTNLFVTYDNEQSILEKCKYAWKKKMAGVMIWELGEDRTMDLMNAVLEGTKRK